MTGPAAHLETLSAEEARAALFRCCGSSAWVDAMEAHAPYTSDEELFSAAEAAWWGLEEADWLEAFAAHPRIGERADPGSPTSVWSSEEQAAVSGTPAEVRSALATANHVYEDKFGHVFLVCATGRSAADMLRELQRRLDNDPATELRVAAGEQAKITRLRLQKLETT